MKYDTKTGLFGLILSSTLLSTSIFLGVLAHSAPDHSVLEVVYAIPAMLFCFFSSIGILISVALLVFARET